MNYYEIKATSKIGGSNGRGYTLDWKGDKWSDDTRKENENFDNLEDAKQVALSEAGDCYDCVTLRVIEISDEHDDMIDVFTVAGTKQEEEEE